MLELKNIRKDYPAGDGNVQALKGVTLKFRESEFVSILGPSGCGKTTMLNIIGGLDQYSEGDLLINGRSTKDFKDRDWDAYRNHSIGFVFQSYNLIPHQTVLQNVELALTLSGVSKGERRKRAVKALEAVGLGDQLKKKTNEMSGGQMQRVAIARALVNDPDIILADEPTGALDTETSIQVMDILQEVAKNRLVIMVTHNPDLAEKYSTRIIRMLDGNIIDDSKPLTDSEVKAVQEKNQPRISGDKKAKKPSMSIWTAFGLSLKNLISKKGRTTLTSFAGSIGIIGIALIFAVSQGVTTYINTIQEDTLSSYPLTIEAKSMDVMSLLTTFMGKATSESDHENDDVYEKGMIYKMLNSLNEMDSTENDLKSFKTYIEEQFTDENSELSQAVAGVQYTYGLNMLVYTKSTDDTIIQSDMQALLQDLLIEYFGMDMSAMMNMQETMMGGALPDMSSMGGMSIGPSMTVFQEMLPGDNGKLVNPVLEKQYDLVYGSWPTQYDEIVLVVDKNNEIEDITLYALGLKSKDEIDALANAALNKESIEVDEHKWSLEELCDMDFRVVFNSDCYTLDETSGLYTDLRSTQAGMQYLYDNGLNLKISGIIRPSEDTVSTMLSGNIGYTSKLTDYVIENGKDNAAVKAQTDNPETDIFTGLPFRENTGNLTDKEKKEAFISYLEKLNRKEKTETYIKIKSIPENEQISQMVDKDMGNMTRADIEAVMLEAVASQTGMSTAEINDYIATMSDEDMIKMIREMMMQQVKTQYAEQVQEQMDSLSENQLVTALDMEKSDYTAEQCAVYYDEILKFSESTYKDNLITLGCVDMEHPASVNLYASTFESKDVIEDAIEKYRTCSHRRLSNK